MNHLHILIADPDSRFADSFKSDPLAQKFPIRSALFGMEAQSALADKKIPIAGVFINPDIDSTNVFSVIKSSLFHRPATPIFLLGEEADYRSFEGIDLSRLGVRGWVSKNGSSYRKIVEMVAPLAISFDAQNAMALASKDGAAGGQVQGDDQSFVAISARDFVSGSKSFFDVYLRLSSGKYLKILLAGDAFTVERVTGYLDKGVNQFFLRNEAQQSYVQFCDTLAKALLNHPQAPASVKAGKILSQGTEVFSFLSKQGVSEANLREGTKFVSNVRQLVIQTEMQNNDHIKQLLENARSAEHSAATTLLAAMLCQALEIKMERPIQIVGAAAMLHNIGLMSLPENLWDEDESKMTKEEVEMYRQHPEIGARILRQVKGVDPAAIQAIEQHHVRRDGRGFPSRISSAQINRVGEIIGISSEYAHMIRRSSDGVGQGLQMRVESEVLPQFSRQIAYAFRSVFFPKAPEASAAVN